MRRRCTAYVATKVINLCHTAMLNSYRRRSTRFRIITLPKSGTYFLTELLTNLNIRKVRVTHVLDNQNGLILAPGEKAIMTIRDPRAFFVSFTHWCDVRCQQILDGRDPLAEFMDMKGGPHPAIWQEMSFDEKLKSTVTGDERALYFTWRIQHFFDQVDAYLDAPNIQTVRFEDMMAWGEDGASDHQIQTIQAMGDFFRIKFSVDEIRDALNRTRGNSITFVRGTPSDWKREFTDENMALYYDRWDGYAERWGYPATTS